MLLFSRLLKKHSIIRRDKNLLSFVLRKVFRVNGRSIYFLCNASQRKQTIFIAAQFNNLRFHHEVAPLCINFLWLACQFLFAPGKLLVEKWRCGRPAVSAFQLLEVLKMPQKLLGNVSLFSETSLHPSPYLCTLISFIKPRPLTSYLDLPKAWIRCKSLHILSVFSRPLVGEISESVEHEKCY